MWRPKFLSGLSLTNSPTLAARFARASKETAYSHKRHDPEFAEQWQEAIEDATEILHSRCFQRALEGDCEQIYYMGIPCGYIRKFDSRLQIEMLRAHKPDTFKTAGVNVNLGIKQDIFVLTEEQRLERQRVNREFFLNSPVPDDSQMHSAVVDNQALTERAP